MIRTFPTSRAKWLSLVAMAVVASGFAISSATAATLTWDPSLTGTGSDANGTWNSTNANWATGSGDVIWPNDTTTAVFGSAGSTVAATVTVSGTVTAGGLTFLDPKGYTLQNGTIDAATGGLTISCSNPAKMSFNGMTISGTSTFTGNTSGFNLQGTNTLSDLTITSGSQVQQQGTLNGAITDNGNGLRVFSGSTTNATITLGSNNAMISSWVASSGTGTLLGNITDGGNGYNAYFFASSPGPGGGGVNIKVSGTGNSWGGATYILGNPTTASAQAAVQLGANNTLPTGTTLVFGKDTTSPSYANSIYGYLDLNGFNQEVAGLRVGNATGDSGFIGNSSSTSNSLLTFNGSAPSTFSGSIQDAFPGVTAVKTVGLTISGGTLILTGDNTYSGGTTVTAGTLLVNGGLASAISQSLSYVSTSATINTSSTTGLAVGEAVSGAGIASGSVIISINPGHSVTLNNKPTTTETGSSTTFAIYAGGGTGAVTVASGATLGGVGIITGATTIQGGGILSPGDPPGTFSLLGGTTLDNNSNLDFTLATPNVAGGTSGNDLVNTTDLALGTGITLNVTGLPAGNAGTGVYHLIDYTGALTDNSSGFSGWSVVGLPLGDHFGFSLGLDGSTNALDLTVSVPEPASLGLLGAGVLGLGLLNRRRKVSA